MIKTLVASSILFAILSVGTTLEAPIPPESLFLKELMPGEVLVDPGFEAWDKAVNEVVEPADMSESEYLEFSKTLSLTEKLFTDLKRLSRQSKASRKSFVANFEKNFADESYKNKLKDHILYPDVLNELIETKYLSKQSEKLFSQEIESWAGHICPQKELILRELDQEDREVMDINELTSMLNKIQRFNSKRFKKMALEDLMEMTDEEAHVKARSLIADSIRSYPKLVGDHPWVLDQEDGLKEDITTEPHRSLFNVTENVRRRRCNSAKKNLINGIKHDTDKNNLPQVATMTSKVESCFRRRGRRARVRFLSRMKKHLEAQYGFPGEEIVLRSKALIYWSRDKFDKTREILSYLIEGAEKGKYEEI